MYSITILISFCKYPDRLFIYIKSFPDIFKKTKCLAERLFAWVIWYFNYQTLSSKVLMSIDPSFYCLVLIYSVDVNQIINYFWEVSILVVNLYFTVICALDRANYSWTQDKWDFARLGVCAGFDHTWSKNVQLKFPSKNDYLNFFVNYEILLNWSISLLNSHVEKMKWFSLLISVPCTVRARANAKTRNRANPQAKKSRSRAAICPIMCFQIWLFI